MEYTKIQSKKSHQKSFLSKLKSSKAFCLSKTKLCKNGYILESWNQHIVSRLFEKYLKR